MKAVSSPNLSGPPVPLEGARLPVGRARRPLKGERVPSPAALPILLLTLILLPLPSLAQDYDSDGMPDSYENAFGCLMPNTVDADVDYDTDEVTSQEEYWYSPDLDPCNPDSDGDGLYDGDEINMYWTDPLNPDSDGDGLSAGDES